MRKVILGFVVMPFLAAAAFAHPAHVDAKRLQLTTKHPVQLADSQMDKISAGFLEIDRSNTSFTILSLFFTPYLLEQTPNTIGCSDCYLLINSPHFSLGSVFGQPIRTPTAPP